MPELNWGQELSEQLTWHWQAQLRPRLDGLTDEEYLWEPEVTSPSPRSAEQHRVGANVGHWNLVPPDRVRTAQHAGQGPLVFEFERPEPSPAPVTTIAWRIGHLLFGVFGLRNARYFGGAPVRSATYRYPVTAAEALQRLDIEYARWTDGVAGLGQEGLRQRCREPHFESSSMAGLILHIHREIIHHGAEIALLRDLYAWGGPGTVHRSAPVR